MKGSRSPPKIRRCNKKLKSTSSSPMMEQSSTEFETSRSSPSPSVQVEKEREPDLKMDEFSDYITEAVKDLIAKAEKLTSGDSDDVIPKLIKSIKWLIWYNEIRAEEIPLDQRSRDGLEACFLTRTALKSNLSVDLAPIKNRMNIMKNMIGGLMSELSK